jgi:hypothetical protein
LLRKRFFGLIFSGARGCAASINLPANCGYVKVDAARISRDVATIANEILQHLASLPNSEISVSVEIQARIPAGVPDNVVRTVSENCRTLKFKSQSFEPE